VGRIFASDVQVDLELESAEHLVQVELEQSSTMDRRLA
jgi:hypothetical protein